MMPCQQVPPWSLSGQTCFPQKNSCQILYFLAIGGVIAGLSLKLLEAKEREKRRREHDERSCKEKEEQLSTHCPCGNCGAFDWDLSRDAPNVREVSSDQDDNTTKEGCVLLSSWLPDEMKEIESCKDISRRYDTLDFTYSSHKELRELVRLHHEVQLLCFQLHVEELAGKKLLPLLEKMDPSDGAFVPLYRMTHGLLCGGGRVFPAMVLDNL